MSATLSIASKRRFGRGCNGSESCRQFRFTVECIQMVIGYLDIFVFEEFVLALRPVVDGGDCVLQADPGIVVPDEIYRGQHFEQTHANYRISGEKGFASRLKQTESFQTDDAKFISFAQMSKGCFYGFSDDFSFSLSI